MRLFQPQQRLSRSLSLSFLIGGGVKTKIQGIEAGAVMISELEHLIAQLGAVGGVIVMIAHQLHLFARFAQDGVVNNDCPVVEGTLIGAGYLAARE